MRNLTQDILDKHIFPSLDLGSILSLSLVCKQLHTAVEESTYWDLCYFSEFSFDTRRLQGSGLQRYRKRIQAKLRSRDYVPDEIWYLQDLKFMRRFQPELQERGVVDYASFVFKGEESDYRSYIKTLAVRCFNGDLFICTEQYARAVVDITGVSQLRIAANGVKAYLRGWRDGETVELDIHQLYLPGVEKEDDDEETAELGDEVENFHDFGRLQFLSMNPQLSKGEKDAVFESLRSRSPPKQNHLASCNPALVYYDSMALYDEQVSKYFGMIPRHLDVLYTASLQCCFWVAAIDNTVYVVDVNQSPYRRSKRPTPNVYSQTFTNKIKKVGHYFTRTATGVGVLDNRGNFFAKWYEKFTRPDLYQFSDPDPQLLYEGVADLVEDTLLMMDGRVLLYHGHFETWRDSGAFDAVMITRNAYLTAE